MPTPQEASMIYRAHAGPLRRWLGTRVGDPHLADDLCQETFVAAFRSGIPAEAAPGAWLFGIARRLVLKQFRDRKDHAPLDAASPPETLAPPEADLQRAERRDRVRAQVADLGPDLREVIELRYAEGLDYREIAARLDLPLTTVQGRLKRARVALRASLAEELTS